MKYLFTNEELSFIRGLVSDSMTSQGTMSEEQSHRSAQIQQEKSPGCPEHGYDTQIKSLIRKGYLYMEERTLVLNPLTTTFAIVLASSHYRLELPDGILYDGGDIFLWVEEDQRKLYGKMVSAYPTLEEWYQMISGEGKREYTLEECIRRIEAHE